MTLVEVKPNKIALVENENEICVRDGHVTSVAYVAEFLKFLYVRTGFKFENFTTPRHLQRLLDEMSFTRVPLNFWNAMMRSALRIVNMSPTINAGLRQFGAFFIDVLVWLSRRLVKIGILSFAVFLLSYCVHPLVQIAIVTLTHLVIWMLKPLWRELSTFIQSRLISAPYYEHFAIMP